MALEPTPSANYCFLEPAGMATSLAPTSPVTFNTSVVVVMNVVRA